MLKFENHTSMKKKWLLLLFQIVIGCSVYAQQAKGINHLPHLKGGDLLFEVSPTDNMITDVTQGIDGLKIDHVAIYWNKQVIEATKNKGVAISSLEDFINRNTQADGRVWILVGRVTSDYHLRKTIKRAKSFIGLPYVSLFLPDNQAIYCSELVQKSYVDKKNKPIFSPIPMSFHDASGNVTDYWKAFYRRFDMEVPEGEPGTNPGELSRRKNVEIIWRFF